MPPRLAAQLTASCSERGCGALEPLDELLLAKLGFLVGVFLPAREPNL